MGSIIFVRRGILLVRFRVEWLLISLIRSLFGMRGFLRRLLMLDWLHIVLISCRFCDFFYLHFNLHCDFLYLHFNLHP